MGLNVRGVATSIKTDNIIELTTLMGLDTPIKVETTYFENAISNEIEGNEIFLTVTKNGIILLFGDEMSTEETSLDAFSENGKALSFMISETGMFFGFDYYENGELLRSVVNLEGENVQEEGDPLEIEENKDDYIEIICSIMEDVCGGSIYSVEPNQKAVRYKIVR